MKARFGALDFYRFIAASGVFFFHFAHYAKCDYSTGFGSAVVMFAMFVDFFFILSGFVIGISYFEAVQSAPEILWFLRKRVARLYPLHVLTLFIFLFPTLIGLSAHPDKWSASSILGELLLVQSWPLNAPLPYNFPSWSISVEWAMYLLFPIVALLCRRAGMTALVFIVVAGFIANTMMADQLDPPVWSKVINPVRAIPTFAAGILISQTYRRFVIPQGIMYGLAAFALAVVGLVFHAPPVFSLVLFAACVYLTASGYAHSSKTVMNNRFFAALGDSSYSLYMLHAIFLSAIIDKAWPRLTSATVPLYLSVVIWLAVVGVSLLSFRYFESPMRRLMTGRDRRLRLAVNPQT